MKKFYLFLLIGLALTQVCHAEEPKITFYDWDGTKEITDDDSLVILVGETREIKYKIEPADYDMSKYELAFGSNSRKNIAIHGNNAIATKASSGTIGFYVKKEFVEGDKPQLLGHAVKIVAEYRSSGPLYENPVDERQVYYSIDADWKLAFWVEELDSARVYDVNDNANEPTSLPLYYQIPDCGGRDCALWYQYRDSIKEIVLNNIDRIGKFAFCDMSKIHYVRILDNIKHMGDSVFYGCNNLTLEVNRCIDAREIKEDEDYRRCNPEITQTFGNSLVLGEDDWRNPIYPGVLIVHSSNLDRQTDALNMYSETYEWSNCGVKTAGEGLISSTVHWVLGQSDSLGTVLLTIYNSDYPNPTSIPDREYGKYYDWDELGEAVKELKISDGITYIGKNAFYSLRGIESIQFNQHDNPLESIHLEAFSPRIFPRKFGMGDPLDGAVRPPQVLGFDPTDKDELEAARERWMNFHENTVLLVPDSLVDDGEGGEIRCIELYRKDPLWGSSFFRINDRTVDTTAADTSMVLKWIPLEKAEGYYLTIHEVGCTTGRCDSTIFIPAEGLLGLLDWVRIREEGLIPQYIAARRAPKDAGDDGGLILTISIEENSGSDHTSDVTVNVAGKKNQDYTFTREVVQLGKIASVYTKGGSFHLPDQATSIGEIKNEDPITDHQSPITNIYDLLGRPLGTSLEVLSDGIYIIDNGSQRTTILLRR